ncbi:MAG: ATP-binding cassette domain-containing protein [Sedimentisphaerales bacterium]|nr:ATP-binding cassette domain-containing protein [Sedimentisphaerales bacterium]
MAKYCISKKFDFSGKETANVAAVMKMFGLTKEKLTEAAVEHSCSLEVKAGDIVYITGPSGAGKSVLLKELERKVPTRDRVNLNNIGLFDDRAVIDCLGLDFLQSLRMLSKAGLSDVFCLLNKPVYLSDGQKYRFRLAMALAASKKFIFADEFCSSLDRITAAVISCNIRRFADRHKAIFILAGSAEDILIDLEPDVVLIKELVGTTRVIYKSNGV